MCISTTSFHNRQTWTTVANVGQAVLGQSAAFIVVPQPEAGDAEALTRWTPDVEIRCRSVLWLALSDVGVDGLAVRVNDIQKPLARNVMVACEHVLHTGRAAVEHSAQCENWHIHTREVCPTRWRRCTREINGMAAAEED